MLLITMHCRKLCIFFIMITKGTSYNDEVSLFISKHFNLCENTPKVWHQYIRIYLNHRISKYLHRQFHCGSCIVENLHAEKIYSNLFVKHASSRVANPTVQYPWIPEKFRSVTEKRPFGYRDIDRPTGQIQSSFFLHSGWCRCLPPKEGLFFRRCKTFGRNEKFNAFQNGWTLVLNDKRFSLNITFHQIYIPVRTVYTCQHGNVSITQGSLEGNKIPTRSLHDSSKTFKYCGRLGTFNLYLPYGRLTHIGVFYSLHVVYKIQAAFMVIDQNVIHNYPRVADSPVNPIAAIFIISKTSIHIFSIIVQKLFFITLVALSQNTGYKVFDGPGILSREIPIQQGVFNTSNFHCTIYAFMNQDSNSALHFNKFSSILQYSTHYIVLAEELFVSHKKPSKIVLNDECCTKSPHAMQVRTRANASMHIHVDGIVYKGEQSIPCNHGGMAIFEMLNRTFTDISSFCHTPTETQKRNIYSHTSLVGILVYLFKPYSHVKVNLTLKESECKAIHIDPCLVRKMCQYREGVSYHICLDYLRKLSGTFGDNFFVGSNINVYPEITYTPKSGMCTILQIRPGQNVIEADDVEYCFITLSMSIVNNGNIVINQLIKGSVENSIMMADYIQMDGLARQFCYAPNHSGHSKCMGQLRIDYKILPNKNVSCGILERSKNRSYETFHITTKTGYQEKLSFEGIGFFGESKSWMDVKIWVSDVSQQSKAVYLTDSIMTFGAGELKPDQLFSNELVLLVKHTNLCKFIKQNITFKLYLRTSVADRFKHKQAAGESETLYMKALRRVKNHEFYTKLRQTPHSLEYTSVLRCFSADSHIISLPGKYENLDVVTEPYTKNAIFSLQGVWIHDMYSQYSNGFQVEASGCTNLNPSSKHSFSFCRNYSLVIDYVSQPFHYVFLGKFFTLKKNSTSDPINYNPTLKSWIEASEACAEIGGHLPTFHSKTEIDELTALIKLEEDFSPVEAIYIGLNRSTKWYSWENSSAPVSYLHFNNHNFGQAAAAEYKISYRYERKYFDDYIDLTSYKNISTKRIYPHFSENHTCTVMLLTNLMKPDWITVNCNQKIVGDILCSVPNKHYKIDSKSNLRKSVTCSSLAILHKRKCFSIFWSSNISGKKLRSSCEALQLNAATTANSKIFKNIMDATHGIISPVFSSKLSNFSKLHTFTFNQTYLKFQDKEIENTQEMHGYYFCSVKTSKISNASNLFACKGRVYISQLQICDGIQDCPGSDNSDEAACICGANIVKNAKIHLCAIFKVSEEKHYCSPLYHMNAKGECSQFQRQKVKNDAVDRMNKTFNCTKDLVIDFKLLNDLIPDCGQNAQDEPTLKDLLRFEYGSLCADKNQIPCLPGHSKCYNTFDICIYHLNELNHLSACRNGKHLQNCRAFECNMMYKCPHYYCIPWSYVCDGKWDCPNGMDESPECSKSNRCATMYKCQGMNQMRCIHLGRLCDERKDCKEADDESLCELKGVRCPTQCQCLALAVLCIDVKVPFTNFAFPYISISIYFSNVFYGNQIKQFQSVLHLKLINVSLTEICGFPLSETIVQFSAQFNPLEKIVKKCFSGLLNLTEIQLQNNNIYTIEAESFFNMPKLRLANLSNNALSCFPRNTLTSTQHLEILSLLGNVLNNIDMNAFQNIKVDVIETTAYQLCCIAPAEAKCTAQKPWYISCSNLLPSNSMRIVYGIISSVMIGLCISSVVLVILSRKSNMAYSITVLSINVNDSLFGVYLIIIFAANEYFQEIFLVKEKVWRSSPICFFSFALILLHNLSSPFLLFFLSLSRLFVVLSPYDTSFKRSKFVSKCIILIYTFALAVTVLLTLVMQLVELEIPTSLCLPFIDSSNSALLVKIITIITSVVQIIMSIIILFTHFVLVKNLQNSEETIRTSAANKKSNVSMIVQLITITTSNIICWFPTNIIYLASMFLPRYPSNMVIWTAVAVAPINSIINPSVCIITSVRKLKENSRKAKKQKDLP